MDPSFTCYLKKKICMSVLKVEVISWSFDILVKKFKTIFCFMRQLCLNYKNLNKLI